MCVVFVIKHRVVTGASRRFQRGIFGVITLCVVTVHRHWRVAESCVVAMRRWPSSLANQSYA
jgi:hypothetical protein